MTDNEPILTNENQHNPNTTLPLLAVRDVVVYPSTQIAIFVGRLPSIKAVQLAEDEHDGYLLLVSQKDSNPKALTLKTYIRMALFVKSSTPCRTRLTRIA